MFNIDWDKIITDNLDNFARQPNRVSRLKVAVYEVKNVHIKFLAFRDAVFKKVYHNGQVIYLEKVLNDTFDNISRDIYIDSDLVPSLYYLFKKSEILPPIYLYKKYSSTVTYIVGDYCEFKGDIFVSTYTVLNQSPQTHPGYWTLLGPVKWLRKKIDFLSSINFIVYVPTALTFDNSQMKFLINSYKQAGKNYLIKLY